MLKSYHNKGQTEAGCDEAGRGCLAGPVVASSVILSSSFNHQNLNDSKKLNVNQRLELEPYIKQHAIEWSIGVVSPQEIDQINILNASILAMHRAIEQLKTKIDLLLIDGNRFHKYKNIPHQCIVKGDSKYNSIAAASVLAKCYRDLWMEKLHQECPHYDWKCNKGYPTKKHRQAIMSLGITKHHRKSFKLLPTQLEIDF
jgi:ribonuclease HII